MMKTMKAFRAQITMMMLMLALSIQVQANESKDDAALMLNRLLHIDSHQYYVKDSDGKHRYDSLSEFKDWEKIYLKYSQSDNRHGTIPEVRLKYLLFVGFIAYSNNDAAISEALSGDLLTVYNANRTRMLKILADLNFLVPSTCYYLNNYFGFEGKNADKKSGFMTKNRPIIKKVLEPKTAKLCLRYFEQ